jgi:hypothetical protein
LAQVHQRSSDLESGRVVEFVCNICGKANRSTFLELARENATCSSCRSTVRTRSLLRVLSLELFGLEVCLPDFPRVKSLRGLGTSDTALYASVLADRFNYTNTFYDFAPRFDIMNPPQGELGRYDFVVSSEVLERSAPDRDSPRECLRAPETERRAGPYGAIFH